MSTVIPQRVHLLGIGGAHMSAIARILLSWGYEVSGSDLQGTVVTEALEKLGARVVIGPHAPANVGDAELVVTTSAAMGDNAELIEAQRRGIPAIKRAEMVGRLMEGKIGAGIAGCHGKSTTSGLVAYILVHAGRDPTYLIGAEVSDLGTNAAAGDGPHVVVEADEYDRAFLSYHPEVALVTNVEADHLDYYGTWEAVQEAFRGFVANVPADGTLVLCANDPEALALREYAVEGVNVVTYAVEGEAIPRAEPRGIEETSPPGPLSVDGEGERGSPSAGSGRDVGGDEQTGPSRKETDGQAGGEATGDRRQGELVEGGGSSFEGLRRSGSEVEADWVAGEIEIEGMGQSFGVYRQGEVQRRLKIALPIRHNVANALGATVVCLTLGLNLDEIAAALESYRGVRRRFELVGEAAGVSVYDDYAHHPTEIADTAAAAKTHFPGRRIVALFQPHTYARTRYLLDGFRRCFREFDRLFILETYAAREAIADGMTGAQLAAEVHEPAAGYFATFEAAADGLVAELKPGDVLFTVGAGDVDSVGPMVLERLRAREAR